MNQWWNYDPKGKADEPVSALRPPHRVSHASLATEPPTTRFNFSLTE
jgi:hypothetical protein